MKYLIALTIILLFAAGVGGMNLLIASKTETVMNIQAQRNKQQKIRAEIEKDQLLVEQKMIINGNPRQKDSIEVVQQ